MLLLNLLYSHIAAALTTWENHRTVWGHQNSLILKRFVFEFFDAFIGLFYLAFYEYDIVKLRSELVAVFHVDTFRRVFCECLLPMAAHAAWGWRSRRRAAAKVESTRTDSSDGEAEAREAPSWCGWGLRGWGAPQR